MNELIKAAQEVRQRAYAPYSKFLVGAAVLTADGDIFVGCNVENASYGLSICAERMAIGAAVAAGGKPTDADSINIKTIVVAATPLSSPCGACRQFISEFGDQIEVLAVDADDPNQTKTWLISDLLPNRFQL